MNHQEIVKLYALVKKYYPMYDGPITPEDIKAFYLVLDDVTLDDAMRNLLNHVKSEKRYPTVADLRGVNENKAYEQYQKVLMNGDNKFVGITEEAIQAMRAVGITPASSREQIAKVRNDFMKFYSLEVERRKLNGLKIGAIKIPEITMSDDRFAPLPQSIRAELESCGVIEGQILNCGNATQDQIAILQQYKIL